MESIVAVGGGVKRIFRTSCIHLFCFVQRNSTAVMFLLGLVILQTGLGQFAAAQDTQFIDTRQIKCALRTLIGLMDGELGALILTVAGVATVVSSAFGQYRAGISLLVVTAGAFTLRSWMDIWFGVDLEFYTTPDGGTSALVCEFGVALPAG